MADDMERNRQQSEQSGQHDRQSGQQGQKGQTGQTGQKKGGQNDLDNENLDQQRRAS